MAALRIGTRGSALALAQAEAVAELIRGAPAELGVGEVELVPIATSGDEGRPSARGGDKSRFVREIEQALLDGEVDLAVHSAKDLPIELPEGLELVGVPPRELPADAFVGDGGSLAELPGGARIGTSSLRRRSQLLALRPDLSVEPLRGNVDTRLRRLAEGSYGGIVLAAAGLRRLGRDGEIAFLFRPRELTPDAGQGALALEARSGDERTTAVARAITHPRSLIELTAERAVVRGLEADCDTPVGVSAVRDAEALNMVGYAGLPDGSESVREQISGDPAQPVALAEALLERLEAAGARELLTRAQSG